MIYKDCFKNEGECFIGLKGSCKCNEPTSGLFVNGLTGVSLKRFAEVANEEQIRGEELFCELEDEAIEKVVNQFLSKLGDDFKFNTTLDRKTYGVVGNEFEDKKQSKGILFERRYHDKYQLLKVNCVSFVSDCATTTEIHFETPCGIEKREIHIKCGINTIDLNYSTKEEWVCVTIINNNQFTIATKSANCGCYVGCNLCNCSCGCYTGELFDVYFEEKQRKTRNGLCFEMECCCDDKPLICHFTKDLKYVVRMQIGIQLMKEAKVSSNIGRYD